MLPASDRQTWLRPVLAGMLAVAALVAAGGATATVVAVRSSGGPVTAVFVDQAGRAPALRALLDRRARAVLGKDRAAFLADVDPAYVKGEEQEYDNLTRLPLAELSYGLEESVAYPAPAALVERFHSGVWAPGVAVHYRITGVDTRAVAAPWVPVFALDGGVWRLAGTATDASLPLGANAQPWDSGPVTVASSARVVAVLSAGDGARAADLLRMSEAALDRVAAVRRGGWSGRVLVTAVQDQKAFDAYFGDSPDRVNQVAAIAVPYAAEVPAWHPSAEYAATRVVINPNQLAADSRELAHDLAHEFTHAAMGAVTVDGTPLWLVEGFAEYVAYKPTPPPPTGLHRVLAGVQADALPANGSFYADAVNYVLAWLSCRLIAQKYGEAKLVALYVAAGSGLGAALRQVLGVDEAALTAQWAKYVETARTATLP